MMGYSPGFPYLTGMNKKLHVNHTSEKKNSSLVDQLLWKEKMWNSYY